MPHTLHPLAGVTPEALRQLARALQLHVKAQHDSTLCSEGGHKVSRSFLYRWHKDRFQNRASDIKVQ